MNEFNENGPYIQIAWTSNTVLQNTQMIFNIVPKKFTAAYLSETLDKSIHLVICKVSRVICHLISPHILFRTAIFIKN